jgi:hypothetical protein
MIRPGLTRATQSSTEPLPLHLGRLLGDRHVREDADPHAADALEVTGDRPPRGLDLPRGDPPGLDDLHAVGAEIEIGAALGQPMNPPFVRLAELGALGLHHDRSPPRP